MAGPAIPPVFYVSFRVAIDAPRHPHRCDSCYTLHRFDRTVALLARNARLDMSLVREMNKIRYVVNFNPRYRLAIFPVRGQLQNFRLLADTRYRCMTDNAFADARNAGNRCRVRVDVAMLAGDLVVSRMYFVTELDWLDRAAIRIVFAVHPYADQQP